MLGWGTSSQTLANLEREGECVINFPHADKWHQVEAIATMTGRNPVPDSKIDQFTFAADKWEAGGFTPQTATNVRPPRIAECAIQCEARARLGRTKRH